MDRDNLKIAAVLCAFALAVVVPVSIAAYMIYSASQQVQVSDYELTMNPLPSNIIRYHNLTITGQLLKDGSGLIGQTIILYIDDVNVATNTTYGLGLYEFNYNVTQTEGSTLTIKTGYQTP